MKKMIGRILLVTLIILSNRLDAGGIILYEAWAQIVLLDANSAAITLAPKYQDT